MQVFARQDFYEACTRQDAGAMVTILGSHGITQGVMSARTGIPQSTLSNYKRGKNRAEWASTFARLADGLGMPQRLREALGVTGDVFASSNGAVNGLMVGGVPADTFDLQRIAEVIGRSGSNVKRRETLTLASQLGTTAALAQSEVWERLTDALTNPANAALNDAVVREMEARSAGFHRLEEIVAAPALLKGLIVQLREVTILISSTASDPSDQLRRRLMVVAGESSVLAGWAASDIGDSAAARSFYDTAITAAEEAGDPAIAACSLAYRSYIPSTKGNNGRSRVLLAEALEIVPRQASPATMAWLSARHAEESAMVGDKAQALRSWGQAEEAYSIADPDEDRVWTRFMDQNRFDSYRIATYAKVGKLDEAQEIAADVLSRLEQPDRKKAAIILEDIAVAHLSRGSVNDAAKVAKSGLAVLRDTEFAMWMPRYDLISQMMKQWQRLPAVRSYLEEYAITKHHFSSQH